MTGYLFTDPEVRHPRDSGMTVLRLAIRRAGTVDYIDVLAGSDQAEVARQLSKGQRLLITGQLRQQRWTTRKGSTRCKHVIAGTTLEPLPSLPVLVDPHHPSSPS
jgi:single-stranded DNA-binding protein